MGHWEKTKEKKKSLNKSQAKREDRDVVNEKTFQIWLVGVERIKYFREEEKLYNNLFQQDRESQTRG